MKMLLAHENWRAEDIPVDHAPVIGEIVTATDGSRYRVRSTSEEWQGDVVTPIATVEPEAGLKPAGENAGALAEEAIEYFAAGVNSPQDSPQAVARANKNDVAADESIKYFAGVLG